MKFELSYTISGQSRTFLYYFGLFGLIDSLIAYRNHHQSPICKQVTWKIVTEKRKYAEIEKS